jgi:hypothetical protein
VPRAILLLSALVFAAIGFSFTFFTRPMAQLVEIHLATDVARTDFTATYGGFALGFAVFLATCATQAAWRNARPGVPEDWKERRPGVPEDWVRPGLIASGCALSGFASVRLIGIVTSAELSPLMLSVLIAEAAGSALSFWAAGRATVASRSVHG